MPKFDVAIYNAEVRRLMKIGERHRRLKDEWADLHYIQVEASDAEAARTKTSIKYPAEQGYVIDHVVKAD